MTTMNIVLMLASSIITALVTFFFVNVSNKTTSSEIVDEVKKGIDSALDTHRKIYHQVSIEDSIKRIDRIEKALIYIVSKLGGDPRDVGLLE